MTFHMCLTYDEHRYSLNHSYMGGGGGGGGAHKGQKVTKSVVFIFIFFNLFIGVEFGFRHIGM